MRIHLIRHGETDWNRDQRIQGRTDILLNENGRAQARALRELYKELEIHVAYTSILSRAIEATDIIGGGYWQLIKKPELNEANMGTWEGMTVEQIKRERPEEWALYRQRQRNFQFPEGESILQLEARVEPCFVDILEQDPDAPEKVIIAHGGSIGAICRYINRHSRLQLSRELIGNCVPLLIEYTPPGRFELYAAGDARNSK
jgi:broad specificity phosphatase PhoE